MLPITGPNSTTPSLVEDVNNIIKSILKKRLEKTKSKWVNELPLALWAYRATHKSVTDHSPITLAYGSKAMVLIELEVHFHQVTRYNPQTNEQLLLEPLDMIDEKHDEAT